MLVSSKGACGLMQVMPRVARQLGFKGSVMDPASNILLAAKVLGQDREIARLRPFRFGDGPSSDRTGML